MPNATEYEITLDGTTYRWVHNGCFCFSHCASDQFYVDGEPCGKFENQELCTLITALIEKVRANDIGKGSNDATGGSHS